MFWSVGAGRVGLDEAMVAGADEGGVVQTGRAAGPPGDEVVGVAVSGWAWAAGEDAAAISERDGLAEIAGEQPGGVAEVEELGLAAQDGGQDVGVAGEAPEFAGWDAVAGPGEGGGADSCGEGVVVEHDGDAGSVAAVSRTGPAREVAVNDGHERRGAGAFPGRLGLLCLGLIAARGACDGFDERPELFSVEDRQSAGELERAVAVVAPSQVLGAAGVALLTFEKLTFGRLGDLGGDHLEQMPGEGSQLPRTVVRCEPDHGGLGGRHLIGVEVGGKVAQHVDHGERLVGRHVAVGHRRCQTREPVLHGSGQCHLTASCRQRLPAGGVQPGRRTETGLVAGDVAFVDRAEHAQLHRGQ